MGFFSKKKDDVSRTNPGYEEHERHTPLMGVILLVIMFATGLSFGWRAMDDLARMPSRPVALSSCSYQYRQEYVRPVVNYDDYAYGGYPSYQYDQACTLSVYENVGNIPALHEQRRSLVAQQKSLQQQVYDIDTQLKQGERELQNLTNQYGVGLQERAGEIQDPLFPTNPLQQQVTNTRTSQQSLQTQKANLTAQLKTITDQVAAVDAQLKQAYGPVWKAYNRQLRWYELKVFMLQFIFIIPLFFLAFLWYTRLHRRNSPYTIISTGIVAVAAILAARVILVWFWGLFLSEVIRVLLEWIRSYQLLRTILFYLGMVLSFVIFGGAVFLLQRKVFDTRRVTIRRFRSKQCPQCQTSLDLAINFCPNCGYQVKALCESCKGARYVGMPVCPACGARK